MNLCLSLDLATKKENLDLVRKIKNYDLWLKVGFRTYIRDGKNFLKELKEINPNFKIFLDLKLYDIPNTMADAAFEIANLGLVDMFNVHASSGVKAMNEVMKRIENIPNKPIVLAVTALTSFDNESFEKVYNENILKKAIQFAKDSYNSNVNGVVCSVYESENIKNNTSNEFITLCPGIRPFGEDSQDQNRVADINAAKKNSVDFIVVGRPIYKSSEPENVVKRILENI